MRGQVLLLFWIYTFEARWRSLNPPGNNRRGNNFGLLIVARVRGLVCRTGFSPSHLWRRRRRRRGRASVHPSEVPVLAMVDNYLAVVFLSVLAKSSEWINGAYNFGFPLLPCLRCFTLAIQVPSQTAILHVHWTLPNDIIILLTQIL
jgi:hypothetical protein